VLAAFAAASVAGQPATGAAPKQRVTFIGDSIAAGVQYEPHALRVLTQGIELDPQLAVCRRLVADSCPYKGIRPLTLVDLLPTIRLAPTVIVSVGYNDPESTFADSVETALDALEKAGAQRVLWLTYREERQQYMNMNDVLRTVVAKHPEVTIVDWNTYSRSHPGWFQDDGLHLGYDGAVGMATLIHAKLVEAGVVQAPVVRLAIATWRLPAARVGQPYLARLRATGGATPVRWTRLTGSLPTGLRLLVDGRVTGTPRAAGTRTAIVRATDAAGRRVSRRVALVVRVS
jgi:Putative Ig domain